MDDQLDLSSLAEPDQGPLSAIAPLNVREVVLDPVFGKRRDALLRTVPLHDLVDRARITPDYQPFDVRALALAAFDAVIARQGFTSPATPAQVTELLVGLAGVQNPASSMTARAGIATHVLDGLTNQRDRSRQFSYDSIMYAAGENNVVMATPVPRLFWLLRELEDPATGEVYLKASVDAVNALVGGLDLPVEDEQAAAELILERQLLRGDLDNAYVSAERARRLSVAFSAKIDDLLQETNRFLPGVDWKLAAPRLVDAAVEHVNECLGREGQLLGHVETSRDTLSQREGPDRSHVADRLVELLHETQHVHVALLRRLMGARPDFLAAQDAQMFRPVPLVIVRDLMDDVLAPLLELRVADADMVVERYLRPTLGPIPPKLVSWGDLVAGLLRPTPRIREVETEPEDVPEYRPDPPPLIDPALLADTRAVLARLPMPTRLSRILAACPPRTGNQAAPSDLISLAALRGFDNAVRDLDLDPSTAKPHTSTPTVVHLLDVLGPDAACHSDGTPLSGAGWDGDDLIVCADRDQLDGVLLGEIPTPTPAGAL